MATSKWFEAPERPCSKCLNGQEKNKDSRNQNVSVELAIMQVRDDMNARREPSTIMLETSNECANFSNDRREFLHAVDLVRGEIQRLLNEQNTRTV